MNENKQLAFLLATGISGAILMWYGYLSYMFVEKTLTNEIIAVIGSVLVVLNVIEIRTEAISKVFSNAE